MWKSAPAGPLSLIESPVQLWRIPLSGFLDELPSLRQILSPCEVTRADQFIQPKHGERYTVAHAALRLILSRYLNCSPNSLEFIEGPYGKPALKQASYLQFNLTHSHELALLAVTQDQAIGIDVEYNQRKAHLLDIAKRFFAKEEYQQLLDLPPSQQQAGFFRCWTLKEALIKAIGLGFSYPLDDFAVDFSSVESANLLRMKSLDGFSSHWHLHLLQIDELYTAALAVENKVESVAYWNFEEL